MLQRSGKVTNGHYGDNFVVGDTVAMELNFEASTLRFWHNDKDLGVAFEHIPKRDTLKYRMCVHTYFEDESVTLRAFSSTSWC